MKVKLIEESKDFEFEERINGFIQNADNKVAEVVDIKFSTDYVDGVSILYSALIMYKEDTQ